VGSWFDDTNYQIGTSPTTLLKLRDLSVPPPDQVIFRPAATYYVRADFKRVGDGFASADWIWDVLDLSSMYKLLSFLNGEDSVALYVVTDRRDGTIPNPKNAFELFYSIMWKPIMSGEEGTPIARSPYALQTVKLSFVHMVEQAGYAL
jgi:hypothetical protein